MAVYKPSVGVQGGLMPLGEFPIAHAKDIEMPDGTRLSEFSGGGGSGYPVVLATQTTMIIKPNTYYVFGTVDSLSIGFGEPDDGKLHEFAFEFTPSSSFSGLTFNGSVQWANEPYFISGKTCQVSIVRGIGVILCAL